LEKVAALLGHSSLNTTRIYITPSKKDLQKAVETLVSRLSITIKALWTDLLMLI
jgi:site-specific recombinase XerD